MNPVNYATLEQSKKMKELGYPQENTDFVWIVWHVHKETPQLKLRGSLIKKDSTYCIPDEDGDPLVFFSEWYAAPSAQEIELGVLIIDFIGMLLSVDGYKGIKEIEFGLPYHAQARASAWIWERENKQ